jgi:hypothetical protein
VSDKAEIQKELERFRDYVIEASKKNLVRLKKSDGKLYKSLRGEVKTMPNSISIQFMMEDYGIYQDAGVNGLKKKRGSKYSFRKGVPNRKMLKSLDVWLRRKGLSPRDKSGKFVKRTSMKFALARSIFNNGLKKSLFFTKPFEAAYKKLPEELVEKYGLDALKLFNQQVDQIIKQNG